MRPKEDWIYVTDFTPAIIDQDLFARAQHRVKEVGRAYSRRHADRPRYWLSGYISCKKCGNGINGATNNFVHRYYRCRGASKSVTGPRTCNAKSLRADELEEAVWEKLVETLQTPQVVMLGMQDHVDLGQGLNAEIRDLENAISNLVSRERNLIRMMSFEGVDSSLVESDLAPINSERRAMENRLQQQRNILSNRRKFAKSMSKVRQFSQHTRGEPRDALTWTEESEP